ncbi:hypothetical protein LINPERHAP1_LOCUS30349, partial [Linum perenne]
RREHWSQEYVDHIRKRNQRLTEEVSVCLPWIHSDDHREEGEARSEEEGDDCSYRSVVQVMAPKGWCLHVLQSFVIRKLFVGFSLLLVQIIDLFS